MDSRALDLAATVVARAGRARPADAVLRSTLKAQRGLSPDLAALASRAVFAYYRWFQWMGADPGAVGLGRALELADRFRNRPESFSDADLVERAFPSWLRAELEITPALARACQAEPKLWLRVRLGRGRELCRKLGPCRQFAPTIVPEALEYFGTADLFRDPAFQSGQFEIQDLSSQAVALLCGPGAGQTWWDACAGEGGKTLHLSDLMKNEGLIWASDAAEWRLKILKRRAARAGVFNYRLAPWTGGRKRPTKTMFDGVLVDAPCSGVGTWQRNPHGRWTTTIQDVRELSQRQRELLAHAAPAVKPGGRLVYSVCTLARSETTAVVEEMERDLPGFTLEPVVNPLRPGAPPTKTLFIHPQDFGGNGMFIAAWRKS